MNKTKQELYQYITSMCEQLEIARYLKNEVKNSLQYFHVYKLRNIEKNLKSFTKYLLFLNEENCRKITELNINLGNAKKVNNNISYYYHHEHITPKEKKEAMKRIECNNYETITLMQGIKGLLLLTIDEFCNASPTRMAINEFIREKESRTKKTRNNT